MADIEKRIKALEVAIQYVPGTDENRSASVLLDMLEELKEPVKGGRRKTEWERERTEPTVLPQHWGLTNTR